MAYQKTEQDKARNAERKKEWYQENREKQYARVKRNQQRIKDWIDSFKENLSCIECGETHPGCLDFHHRDPSQKKADISKTHLKGWSLDRVKQEIEKCDILCSNCHRKLHWLQKHGSVNPHSDKV